MNRKSTPEASRVMNTTAIMRRQDDRIVASKQLCNLP